MPITATLRHLPRRVRMTSPRAMPARTGKTSSMETSSAARRSIGRSGGSIADLIQTRSPCALEGAPIDSAPKRAREEGSAGPAQGELGDDDPGHVLPLPAVVEVLPRGPPILGAKHADVGG